MNGYEHQQKLLKVRKFIAIPATAQALYYELGSICNTRKWVDVFECKNATLTDALSITENTLVKARESLVKAGLVYYVKMIGRGARCRYSFTQELQSNYAYTEALPEVNTVEDEDLNQDSDLNTSINGATDEVLNSANDLNPAVNTSINGATDEVLNSANDLNPAVNTSINGAKIEAPYIKSKHKTSKESDILSHAREEISEKQITWNSKPKHEDVPEPAQEILQAICEAQVRQGKPGVHKSDVLEYWKIWKVPEIQGDKFYASPQEVHRYFANHCRGKTIAAMAVQNPSSHKPTGRDTW